MLIVLMWISLLVPALAVGQVSDPIIKSSNDSATLSVEPVKHTSFDGDFRITFPSGCSKVVKRSPIENGVMPGDEQTVNILVTYCDRYQEKGEGCSVTSYFQVVGDDGGYPGPGQVIERVVALLKSTKMPIAKQKSVHKDLPDGTFIEGIEIFAADPGGVGQAWLRGLLYEGDIYVLMAWKSTGQLWDDPEYITFFNSFQPGAE